MASSISSASLLALASGGSARIGIGVTERSILCSDGIQLSLQHWKSSTNVNSDISTISKSKPKIVCLHGWLDNSSSFHLLAPSLIQKGCASEVIALDLPGHGRSSHKSVDGPPQLLADYVHYVAEAAEKLILSNDDEEKFTLIGHSMSAGVSIIYAAAWPEKIEKLVLLEALGPYARNARNMAQDVRVSIEKRMSSNKSLYPQFSKDGGNKESSDNTIKDMKGIRIYPNIEKAVQTRLNTARLSPGKQYISREAAQVLVERSIKPAPKELSHTGEEVMFRHDSRLNWPSLQYITYEQAQGLLQDIKCPKCVILGEDGWPMPSSMKEAAVELMKPDILETLPGSHHLHADPEHAGPVIDLVSSFLMNDEYF